MFAAMLRNKRKPQTVGPECACKFRLAWEQDRNANQTKANWHFSTSNAATYQTQAPLPLNLNESGD
jgi:hypothetical protein